MLNNLFIKTPRLILEELNKHIVGQQAAKKAVAIALRNRHRRRLVSESMRNEIKPKNILMIGSTGVGKTEIARRLAKLDNAPFIKVEVTKFTEIGYVGRDVESIIRDLVDISIKLVFEERSINFKKKAFVLAQDRLLDFLLLDNKGGYFDSNRIGFKDIMRKKLLSGEFDEKEVDIDVKQSNSVLDFMSVPGMENMTNHFNSILNSIMQSKKKKIRVKVKEALNLLQSEELEKFLNKDELKQEGIKRVENSGIVFLDEIDKIVQDSEKKGSSDISREGVQRDLLPLIDGCNVMTKYGLVKTNYILFIAAGAFHISKPSDLIPELQGRLPICVKLSSLGIDDFVKILIEPNYSLIKQYIDLLKVEGVNLLFSNDSILAIAEIAYNMNQRIENIGARRLYTIMEKLLEDILFDAGDSKFGDFTISKDYVYRCFDDVDYMIDFSRFIL